MNKYKLNRKCSVCSTAFWLWTGSANGRSYWEAKHRLLNHFNFDLHMCIATGVRGLQKFQGGLKYHVNKEMLISLMKQNDSIFFRKNIFTDHSDILLFNIIVMYLVLLS